MWRNRESIKFTYAKSYHYSINPTPNTDIQVYVDVLVKKPWSRL